MPNFSAEGWESFRSQFMSVIRFIMYCFDMFFDTCRSNPMLYAFFFFPVFALAFFLIFEMLIHITPFVSLINNKQVRGVLSGSKLSAKSYGKSMSSSGSVQNLAAKKAAADAKSHAALISKVNGSGSPGTGYSTKAMSSSGSSSVSTGRDIKSFAEGKDINGSTYKSNLGRRINSDIKHQKKVKAARAKEAAKEKEIDKKVEEFDKAKAFRKSIQG